MKLCQPNNVQVVEKFTLDDHKENILNILDQISDELWSQLTFNQHIYYKNDFEFVRQVVDVVQESYTQNNRGV